MVAELRPPGPGQGRRASAAFMAEPRRSRAATPVFLGDDLTDEAWAFAPPRRPWAASAFWSRPPGARTAARAEPRRHRCKGLRLAGRRPSPGSCRRHDGHQTPTADLDLAPIGNSSVSALIDRSGRFVWACAPRFDSDPLFSSLLSDRDPAVRRGAGGFGPSIWLTASRRASPTCATPPYSGPS